MVLAVVLVVGVVVAGAVALGAGRDSAGGGVLVELTATVGTGASNLVMIWLRKMPFGSRKYRTWRKSHCKSRVREQRRVQ